MAWTFLGNAAPIVNSDDWAAISQPLTYSLLRLSFSYGASFVERNYPKGFIRLRVGMPSVNASDENHGVTETWDTIFPRDDDPVIMNISNLVVPIGNNYFEVRRSLTTKSRSAQWVLRVEQFVNPKYAIVYD